LIDGLTKLGRRVITFDPPASGYSTRPSHLGLAEMHQCADESRAVCGERGPVDAMGHSMGGLTTLAYAVEHPQRVKRLVLVGTGSGGPAYMKAPGALWNSSHPAFWRMAALGVLHIVWPRLGPQKLMLNLIERYSFCDQSMARPRQVTLADWLRPREGRTDWHRIAQRLNYAPRLGGITAPTLILCGCHDPQFPPTASAELAAGIKNARAVYFEHSGHYPFLEEPEAFWSAVGGFLATGEARGKDGRPSLTDQA
ncbi:MAG: alpha/beta fold hydrolase, partial [Chloroflexota bacterium]